MQSEDREKRREGHDRKGEKGARKAVSLLSSFNDYRTDYEETDLLCGQKMLKGERGERDTRRRLDRE